MEFLTEEAKMWGSYITGFAIRTKFFDNFIEEAIKMNGINQIIIINGGLDTRPYRLQCLTKKQSKFQKNYCNMTYREASKIHFVVGTWEFFDFNSVEDSTKNHIYGCDFRFCKLYNYKNHRFFLEIKILF